MEIIKVLIVTGLLIASAHGRTPSRINFQKPEAYFSYNPEFKVTKFKKVNRVRSRMFQKKPFKIIRYNTFDVELTSTYPKKGESPKQKLFYLKHDDEKVRPLVIVIPSIMEVTPLEKLVARGLLRKGFNVFIPKLNQSPVSLKRSTSKIFEATKSILTGIRRTIDFAETIPSIDTSKIGTWGNSLGGILNSYLAGIEPRIDALYISVAGGNFTKILTESKSTIVAPYRLSRLLKEKIDLNGFKKALDKAVKADPLDFAYKRSRDDIFMNIAVYDDVVPTKHQIELWKSFGKPNCRIYTQDHFYSVITANAFYSRDYFSFFREKLLHEGELKKASFGDCYFKKEIKNPEKFKK